MSLLFTLLAAGGAASLFLRMWPRNPSRPAPPAEWPPVSIIVPARNEEKVLPKLLASLKQLTYPHLEIIIVDDRSTDKTGELARASGFKTILSAERPARWKGPKSWACYTGAQEARGRYLLFTDADTTHQPQSVQVAVSHALAKNLALLTTLPYHRCETLWERLMGPFHFLLLASTAPYSKPSPGRVYANGQYLMFEREYYLGHGGHHHLTEHINDDLAAANLCLRLGRPYEVLHERGLYQVRMYDSLPAFVAGWARNFRFGFQYSSPFAGLTMTAYFCALGFGAQWPLNLLIGAASWLLIASTQRIYGNFSLAMLLLWP
ncbi:MAG TPA: glycosyltransferase family 2 protein, partial [Bdellovibrionales bacterium]|nr:glycosyltransferase family 2 protein [Bdellovibrionales bacterium]